MKNCDEWVKHILEVRDKQLELKRKRRKAILSCSAFAACFCVTFLLGNQIFKSVEDIKKDNASEPSCSSEICTTSVSMTEKTVETTINETTVSVKEPDRQSVSVTTKNINTSENYGTGTEKKQTYINNAQPVTTRKENETSVHKNHTSAPKKTSLITNITRKTTVSSANSEPDIVTVNTKFIPEEVVTHITRKTIVSSVNSEPDVVTVNTKFIPGDIIETRISTIKCEKETSTFPEVIYMTSKVGVTEIKRETVTSVISAVIFY